MTAGAGPAWLAGSDPGGGQADFGSFPRRVEKLLQRLETAANQARRDPREVNVALAAKRQGADAAARLGQELAHQWQEFFGSPLPEVVIAHNRVGELVKMRQDYAALDPAWQVGSVPVRWHLIGHLQSNKITPALAASDLIQSLDSAALAGKLVARLPADRAPFPVFVQVNVAREDTKSGVSPEQLPALLGQLGAYRELEVCGLMAIGANHPDLGVQAGALQSLAELRGAAEQQLGRSLQLSVGMSADLELAVAHGSTMVRIGTALFGERS